MNLYHICIDSDQMSDMFFSQQIAAQKVNFETRSRARLPSTRVTNDYGDGRNAYRGWRDDEE